MDLARMFKLFLLFTTILTIETTVLCCLFSTKYPLRFSSTELSKQEEASPESPEPKAEVGQKEISEKLEAIMGEDAERFSIYLLRPGKETEPLLYQSRPMSPASMIKLFVLAEAMQEVRDGRASLDDMVALRERDMVDGAGILTGYEEGTQIPLRKLMELMITESDNTATNILIDRVGMERVNQYLKEQGYRDTLLQHKMMLSNRGKRNLSSARDVGVLLTRIYRRECVGDPYDELMINFLMRQTDSECFPKALPSWHIAHKTGEVSGLYDDGGIFYGEKGDFILVIMSDSYSGRDNAIQTMQEIARYVAGTL